MMIPNLHDYVVEHLMAAKGRWAAIASESGVPLRTLEKIARREVEDPRVSSVQRLADYFVAANEKGAGEGGHAAP